MHQGNIKEAEALCEKALKITERELGPEHPDAAAAMNSLAILYTLKQKCHEKAKPLHKEALDILEITCGKGHPMPSPALSGLAVFYHSNKDYGKVEEFYRKSIESMQDEDNRMNSLPVLFKLAELYRETGRSRGAQELEKKAGRIEKNAFLH